MKTLIFQTALKIREKQERDITAIEIENPSSGKKNNSSFRK